MVAAIRQGDREQFRALYDRTKDRLYRTSLALCANRLDAEDVLQESYVKIFRKIHSLRNPKRLDAWMTRIVVNTAKSKLRQSIHWDDQKENDLPASDTIDDLQNWNELIHALQRLPRGFRTVFVLHAVQEIPQETVATILGISVGTVKSQYHRARLKLQTILSEMGIQFER